jgi:hypothetical protein
MFERGTWCQLLCPLFLGAVLCLTGIPEIILKQFVGTRALSCQSYCFFTAPNPTRDGLMPNIKVIGSFTFDSGGLGFDLVSHCFP